MDVNLLAAPTSGDPKDLLQALPVAVISLALDRSIRSWNPSATQLFARPDTQALGTDALLLLPEDRTEELLVLFRKIENGEISRADLISHTRGGAGAEIALTVTPLRDAVGELTGFCLLAQAESHCGPGERQFLQRALLEATERESRRIGQELHDHLCQQLLGAAFCSKALSNGLPPDSKVSHELNDLARMINSAVQHTRDIARGLNPLEMGSDGLMSALQELAARPRAGFTCRLECARPVLLPDARTALNAYRIAQEAVANAAQHSGGSEIILRLTEEENHVVLKISDNGRFSTRSLPKRGGFGLAIMKIRAAASGGRLTVDTAEDDGFHVSCSLPKFK